MSFLCYLIPSLLPSSECTGWRPLAARVQRQVTDLLAKQLIEPSTSPVGAPHPVRGEEDWRPQDGSGLQALLTKSQMRILCLALMMYSTE